MSHTQRTLLPSLRFSQTANLVKHLTFLRQSFGISPGHVSPSKDPNPPPRARRPLVDPNSLQMPKLSRAPNVPGIYEEEEIASSPEEDEEEAEHVPSPTIRRKARSRLAASRLPLPARASSPPPLPTPPQAAEEPGSSSKRRAVRRENEPLNINAVVGDRVMPPRASSPAFGSPARREAGLAEDDEEQAVVRKSRSRIPIHNDDLDYIPTAKKEKEKMKMKQAERDLPSEEGDAVASSRVRERKRRRHEDSGLKDVTNSPRSRAMLPPIDTNTSGAAHAQAMRNADACHCNFFD